MPPQSSPPPSKLAVRRRAAGVSQRQLADLTGLALRTVQRLDQGKVTNPPIRYLTNIALALDCDLAEIAEDEWLEWTAFDQRRPARPSREQR